MFGKVHAFVNLFTHQSTELQLPCDALYAEIEQLERTLSQVATKPLKVSGQSSKPMMVAPVSERQKLIDLAG